MASALSFSGIASGIDSQAIIDSTVASARLARVQPNQKKVGELEERRFLAYVFGGDGVGEEVEEIGEHPALEGDVEGSAFERGVHRRGHRRKPARHFGERFFVDGEPAVRRKGVVPDVPAFFGGEETFDSP